VTTEINQSRDSKILLGTSIFLFLYFSLVAVMFEFKNASGLAGVIREQIVISSYILYIPFAVTILVLIPFCGISWIKQKFKIKTHAFYSLVILLLTIAVIYLPR
jgi:hypothetical protein